MKNVIVTGANSGLGLWTTKYLVQLDYCVIMACRNVDKAKKAIEEFLPIDQNKKIVIKELDLADFESIHRFVKDLAAYKEIYALDCNAGMSYEGPLRYTKNGIEATFGTNFVGHFLLTNLLLKKYNLERIVMVSSELHNPKNKSPFAKASFKSVPEMAHPQMAEHLILKKQTQSFYATSKLCNILFSYELDRRLKRKGLKTLVNAINPGLMLTTNLGRTKKFGENLYRMFLDLIFKIIGLSDHPKRSAKSVVRLIDQATSSGHYFDKDQPISSSEDSYDLQKALMLWEGSEVLVGAKFL